MKNLTKKQNLESSTPIIINVTTKNKTLKSLNKISNALLGYELPLNETKNAGNSVLYKLDDDSGFQPIKFYITMLMQVANEMGHYLKIMNVKYNETYYTSTDYI